VAEQLGRASVFPSRSQLQNGKSRAARAKEYALGTGHLGEDEVRSTANRADDRTNLCRCAENVRDLSVTLLDMAHANIEAAFEFARQAATARTPSDLLNLWTTHVPKQLQQLGAQTKELTELGQKLSGRSAPPITPDG
jgi:glycerol-3-phosphate dehydrogenase